jgi:hypothetical protein
MINQHRQRYPPWGVLCSPRRNCFRVTPKFPESTSLLLSKYYPEFNTVKTGQGPAIQQTPPHSLLNIRRENKQTKEVALLQRKLKRNLWARNLPSARKKY